MLVRAVRQGQVTPPSSGLSINICTGLGNACVSTITRYVWAGDQVLWELRAPGADGQNLESVGDGTYPSSQAYLFGQVSYLHAGGIDRPLTIWKRNVGAVRPHQNWRGLFFRGTWGTSSVPDTPPVGTTANCVTVNVNECLPINWPGDRTTAWHESRGGESALWMGGLVDGMRDPTGQVYMRNRYYNPQTGQFTQMDPIGIAGGLNAYGFAAGDPVSYADPYGLCPPLPDCFDPQRTRLTREVSVRMNAGDEIRLPIPANLTGTSAVDIRFTTSSRAAYGVNEYDQDVVVFWGGAKADFPEGVGEDARWWAQLAGDAFTLDRAALNIDTGEYEATLGTIGVSIFIDGNVNTESWRSTTCVMGICNTVWSEDLQNRTPPREREQHNTTTWCSKVGCE